MPHSCAAWNCSKRCTPHTKSEGITFHRFPKDTNRRKQWEVALRRDGFRASSSSMLCSEHFKPEDMDRTGQTVRIRDGVIPSVFSFPAHLQRPVATRTTESAKKAQESFSVDGGQCEEDEQLPVPNVDHSYTLPSSPDDLRARLSDALARAESLERDKRNAKDRERRAKKTVSCLLKDLREKKLINEELQDKLDSYSTKNDLPVHLLSKNSHEFTKDQREFAITLHLHGPKAYSYLRETLKINLPHPHTLQRWMSSVDAKPGLNMAMLDMLKKKREEDPARYECVCLMLDAMAIKKHIQYNPQTKKMSGYVDMGDGVNETDIATEALVFMVVGLQGSWKAPVAYFLTDSLSPDTQEVLLLHALEELHERGIRVLCVTMDGHASNVSMCNKLGCQLKGNPVEPLKTFFLHPVSGDRVFVMMDACHMLKLARNMLQAYSPIKSKTGQINWNYILHLNDVQTKDGLHMANKVTDKHVNFDSQKMKVALAAQTLSRSVSVALRTLRDLGYSQFQHCEATAEFIEIIDRLFDILNSRNPHAKGFKAPLGFLNWPETVQFLVKGRDYLMSLMMANGTPLHRSKRYLSVLGFIINIDTLTLMIPEQLQRQRYICTYRFSQDHLELLFNSIRGAGGWNNNPSACQFQAIFRRIMVRCGVSPSASGNVVVQDQTVSLCVLGESSSPRAEATEEIPSPFANITAIVSDHSYLPTRFGGLVDNALVYISGFVVRQILKRLMCDVCRGSLVTDAVPASFDMSYHLLELKNNGGLMVPSEGTVRVVRSAERFIRLSLSGQAVNVALINQYVRADIGAEDVFGLGVHIQETQSGIDNYHYVLM